MRLLPRLCAFGSALIFATAALAATVTPERGEVLVSSGSGFKTITQPTEVAAGDLIMAKPKSGGQIAFPDGCIVKVAPGSVFAVAAKSPCVRTGHHIETAASPPPQQQPPPSTGSDALPFIAAVGATTGMMLLPTKDKATSP